MSNLAGRREEQSEESAMQDTGGLGKNGSPKKKPTMLGNFTMYKVNKEFDNF